MVHAVALTFRGIATAIRARWKTVLGVTARSIPNAPANARLTTRPFRRDECPPPKVCHKRRIMPRAAPGS